jgi:hypothetical protein
VIGGKKRAPYLKKEEVDPRRLLWLAVQLSGSPLEHIGDKKAEGPGFRIPHMPLELQQEWGKNVGLLQSLNIMFAAGGKVRDFKWAQGQNMTVNSAMMRFAIAHGLEDELRAWSDPNHEALNSRISDLEDGILRYNTGLRDRAANTSIPPKSPTEAMGEIAPGASPSAAMGLAVGAKPVVEKPARTIKGPAVASPKVTADQVAAAAGEPAQKRGRTAVKAMPGHLDTGSAKGKAAPKAPAAKRAPKAPAA